MAEEPNRDEIKKRENHFIIDSEKNLFTVVIHLDKDPATGLGTLEMAKDQLKSVYMQKAVAKAQGGLLIPNGKPNGGMHVA